MDIIKKTTIILIILISFQIKGFAGNLEPPGGPTDPLCKTYDLNDLYNRLISGEFGTKKIFSNPSKGPSPSFRTLNEIMEIMPQLDNINGGSLDDMTYGKTFWGLKSNGGWGLLTGTKNPASIILISLVRQTGQTQCYDENGQTISCTGTGQDGETQAGIPVNTFRFTDNKDGTVTDNLTSLMWMHNADVISTIYPEYDTDETPGDGEITWQHALDFVYQANSKKYTCGLLENASNYNNWRLPTYYELLSLLNLNYFSPALSNSAGTDKWSENDPFINVQLKYYWTSTSYSYSATSAWKASLAGGGIYHSNKKIPSCVWLVRTVNN